MFSILSDLAHNPTSRSSTTPRRAWARLERTVLSEDAADLLMPMELESLAASGAEASCAVVSEDQEPVRRVVGACGGAWRVLTRCDGELWYVAQATPVRPRQRLRGEQRAANKNATAVMMCPLREVLAHTSTSPAARS
jgi:hypothetical protein